MNDKQIEYLMDATDGVSNCCGASIRMGFCNDCRDHCEDVSEKEKIVASAIHTAQKYGQAPDREDFDSLEDAYKWATNDYVPSQD